MSSCVAADVPPCDRTGRPPRVLLLTASVGEGHNSAAAAIESVLREHRPDVEIHTLDTFTQTRGGLAPLVRRLYQLSVEACPAGYQLWYQAVASWDWCHALYRERVGARVGRALGGELERFRPDVVVSTYPLATAALAWRRRQDLLRAPVLAFLSDFAPHRFWVYPGVDQYLVLSEPARAALRRMAPNAPVTVCPPAVDAAFRSPTPAAVRRARQRFALPTDQMVVLVSTGAMAMGRVRATVRAVQAAGAHAVITCGRDGRLLRSLRRDDTDAALTALDWTEDMPGLVSACDVVVNNAGGATAAEALAAGRALVMFRPIPGHGRASAALLARTGLADTCSRHRALTELLAGWAGEPRRLRDAQRRAQAYAATHARGELAAAVFAGVPALGRG